MKRKLMAELWNNFSRNSIPNEWEGERRKQASSVLQVTFYSGARDLFCAILDDKETAGVEEDFDSMIAELRREFMEFSAELRAREKKHLQ